MSCHVLFIYSLLVQAARSLSVQSCPVRAAASVDSARFYTPVSVWYQYFFFPLLTTQWDSSSVWCVVWYLLNAKDSFPYLCLPYLLCEIPFQVFIHFPDGLSAFFSLISRVLGSQHILKMGSLFHTVVSSTVYYTISHSSQCLLKKRFFISIKQTYDSFLLMILLFQMSSSIIFFKDFFIFL